VGLIVTFVALYAAVRHFVTVRTPHVLIFLDTSPTPSPLKTPKLMCWPVIPCALLDVVPRLPTPCARVRWRRIFTSCACCLGWGAKRGGRASAERLACLRFLGRRGNSLVIPPVLVPVPGPAQAQAPAACGSLAGAAATRVGTAYYKRRD
jgi:hypothetical protein